MKQLGVLRTRQMIGGAPGDSDMGLGNRFRDGYDVVPDRALRNDGYHDCVLYHGVTYRLFQDSIGWRFVADQNTAYDGHTLYLVGTDHKPASTLEMAHKTHVLCPGREYAVKQDDTAQWVLLETSDVPLDLGL